MRPAFPMNILQSGHIPECPRTNDRFCRRLRANPNWRRDLPIDSVGRIIGLLPPVVIRLTVIRLVRPLYARQRKTEFAP